MSGESHILSERVWYVAKTKPRQEEQTGTVLAHRGVEVYLPKVAVRPRTRSDARATRLEPLFPGYLFARLCTDSPDWVVARSAPGVAYFLGADGKPSPVPGELVARIMVRVEDQRRHGWQPRFRNGDRVVITSGPFAGIEAIFDGTLSASGRSRVFVEIVSRLVPVVVSAGQLDRAG